MNKYNKLLNQKKTKWAKHKKSEWAEETRWANKLGGLKTG